LRKTRLSHPVGLFHAVTVAPTDQHGARQKLDAPKAGDVDHTRARFDLGVLVSVFNRLGRCV
jgi:hypothetical protein